ncbi:MAG: alpha-galactosidase [Clostridia bacterium]|nr:alpha-galactosidase [Clostridia bacterium]
MERYVYETEYYTLRAGGCGALEYLPRGAVEAVPIGWPRLELDGRETEAAAEGMTLSERRFINSDIEEAVLCGRTPEGLTVRLFLRSCAKTPFIRFRYELSSEGPSLMTKKNGERLVYLSYSSEPGAERTEVRLSVYDRLLHSYRLRELKAFEHEGELCGPILTERRGNWTMLTAYEHGSAYPEVFIAFVRTREGIELRAVKGNYTTGYDLSERPYGTVWLQLGAVEGGVGELARAYRAFQLSYCSPNRASRTPYIYYNTWAFQERNRFRGHRYLSSMDQARMEREIDVAAKMGVDVFVIDTGWYEKTGDWLTDRTRFPDGMEHIRGLLDRHGMKLGLWFAPCKAAKTSAVYLRRPGAVQRTGGEEPRAYPVWETEESFDMCPVSEYWEDFADKLIELADTLGVRYFKWDSVEPRGCDCPDHYHGGRNCSAAERAENHAFQVGLYMSKIADRVCAAVPDAVVDMDVTESGRYVGLGFLSSGKFFTMNNGPYYGSFDIEIPDDKWSNVFVNPGPARAGVCRGALSFDRWIPSVLTLTHYLPDDPESSQLINLASLVLGQNGIWGDLPEVSDRGVKLFSEVLGEYRLVREDAARAYPEVYGAPGESFEAYEKLDPQTGRGLVSFFANTPGEYRYRITSRALGEPSVFGPAVLREEDGDLWAELSFDGPGAAIVFFK